MQFSGILSEISHDFRDIMSTQSEPKRYIIEEDKENMQGFEQPAELDVNTSNSDPTSINFEPAPCKPGDNTRDDIWEGVNSANIDPFEFDQFLKYE